MSELKSTAPILIPQEKAPLRDKHLPALDGLRGWAVLAVMFYHFALPVVQQESQGPGWKASLRLMLTGSFGVDMFFVLSGFLITGILLDSKNSPRYFRTFYMRRTLRIFPLYYGVLAVCFGLLFWVPIFKQFVPYQLWLWLYGANFAEVAGITFDPAFSHFWSLAVEEHFYLAWPVVVLLLTRRQLMLTAMGMAIFSPLLRCLFIAGGAFNAELAALLTPLRLEGLAMGALLACIARSSSGLERFKRPAIGLILVGGIGTVILKVLYGSASGSVWSLSGVGHFTICATVAGILVLAVTGNGFWAKFLSLDVLRFLGKYSYGLYVFHYLLQPWMDSRFWYLPQLPVVSLWIHMGILFAITLAVAFASWHLYEKQFLKLKKLFEYDPRQSSTSATDIAAELQPEPPVRNERASAA